MYTKLTSWLATIIYTLTFFFTSLTVWVPPAQADCFLIFFCSSQRSSFKSKGGVKRGPCTTINNESLIAFTPDRKHKKVYARGNSASTTKPYPTLWFYLPHYKDSIKEAKLVLLDEQKHLAQNPIFIELPKASNGVLTEVTLPTTGKPLELGKQYSWYFSILCDPEKPSRNPEVAGKIQLVLPSKLPKTQEPDYVVYDSTYKGKTSPESFVFYDTITQLVKNHKAYPSDWSEFLRESEVPANTALFVNSVARFQ
jgi:hypothetical protein